MDNKDNRNSQKRSDRDRYETSGPNRHFNSDYDSERSLAPRDYSQDQYAHADRDAGYVRGFDRSYDEGYRAPHMDRSTYNRPTELSADRYQESQRPSQNGHSSFGRSNGTRDYYRDQTLAPYNDTYQRSQPSGFEQFSNHSTRSYGQQNSSYSQPSYQSSGGSLNSWQRSSAGEHAGKGPKGYKRSDERIREDVSEMLQSHGDIDASEIEINVKEGVVTMTGSVESRRTKRLTEEWVENMTGVKDVKNELRVESTEESSAKSLSSQTNSSTTAKNGRVTR